MHADVATMAALLATCEGLYLADERACIHALIDARFQASDIEACIDDARREAALIRAALIDAELNGPPCQP